MGDEHNPARYGELWPQPRLDVQYHILCLLRPYIVLSGGWAWHFMSPPGHPEYKHAHDHKDIDLMVPKADVGGCMQTLLGLGFKKVRTKYDRLPSEQDFRRYEKEYSAAKTRPAIRVTIDFFVMDAPFIEIPSDKADEPWRVVEPATLITYYSNFHSSSSCFAVQAAKRLLDQGVNPVGRPELAEIPS